VDADEAVRLERVKSRGRPGDPETLGDMRRLEGREQGGDDPAGQQLAAVRALADFELQNTGSLAHLHTAHPRALAFF